MSTIRKLILASSLMMSSAAIAQAPREPDDELDGIIYIGQNQPPAVGQVRAGTDFGSYSDPTSAMVTVYERVLAVWKDPFTLPHTRVRCVKWAKWPGGKTCIGWAVDEQWMYVRLILSATYPDQVAVKVAIEKCLKEAAIVAALTAVVSTGAAAIPAFESTMKQCLIRELGKQVDVSARTESYWGPWQ